jgi:hypothetical protein
VHVQHEDQQGPQPIALIFGQRLLHVHTVAAAGASATAPAPRFGHCQIEDLAIGRAPSNLNKFKLL